MPAGTRPERKRTKPSFGSLNLVADDLNLLVRDIKAVGVVTVGFEPGEATAEPEAVFQRHVEIVRHPLQRCSGRVAQPLQTGLLFQRGQHALHLAMEDELLLGLIPLLVRGQHVIPNPSRRASELAHQVALRLVRIELQDDGLGLDHANSALSGSGPAFVANSLVSLPSNDPRLFQWNSTSRR